MKISTQRAIDRWAGQLLCALVSLGVRWRRGAAAAQLPAQPRHLLVILLSEMGSVVLAGPMFAELRRRWPQATLHVMQLHKNQEVARLLGLASEANLHAIDDRSLARLLASVWRTSRQLRALGVDAVIDCELFSRISALLAWASGARVKVGFTPHTQEGLYRGSFIDHAIAYNPYQHISLQFLALVDALSANTVPRHKAAGVRVLPTETGLAVPFEPAELLQYQEQLTHDQPVFLAKKRVLIYAGGGLLPERAWPAAHYAELARGLVAAGHAVGLIGLKDDAPLARQLCASVAHPACVDLTGTTHSIRELLMLMHACQLLVTNDGGPGHFASLTPIRTLVFFGPETARLYGPLGPRAQVFELGWACSPCLSAYNHRQTLCDGDNQCLKRLPSAPVLREALQILQQPEPA